MLTVNIFDNTCMHHLKEDGYWTSTWKRKPVNIEFKQRLPEYDGITLFTDDFILSDMVTSIKSKLKIAWCLESPAVKPYVHNNIERVADRFDYILTYRQDLISNNPYKFLPNSPGGTYISDDEILKASTIKSKKISMVLSGKKDLEGHILRHRVQHCVSDIDTYGWGSPRGTLNEKSDAMRDYMYHMTIENTRAYHYFSEKLIDCLLMKCIPIYWGCLNIGDYFDTEGFIIFGNLQELNSIKLSKKFYDSKLDIINKNYEIAKQYISSDDYLATKLNNIK